MQIAGLDLPKQKIKSLIKWMLIRKNNYDLQTTPAIVYAEVIKY